MADRNVVTHAGLGMMMFFSVWVVALPWLTMNARNQLPALLGWSIPGPAPDRLRRQLEYWRSRNSTINVGSISISILHLLEHLWRTW